MCHEPERTPDGREIPEGHHWDGVRIVKTYSSSKRPKHIPTDFWSMLGPTERQKIIKEKQEKAKDLSIGGSSSSKAKKKGTVARIVSNRVSDENGYLNVGAWEVLPENGKKFSVTAMPVKPGKCEEAPRTCQAENPRN